MLKSLSVENFAVTKSARLEFSQGFCALTGETGAGKSMLVDALSAALGSRADSSWVRQGSAKATVSAVFDAGEAAIEWMRARGIECEDGEASLRRSIEAEGRSKAWINGVGVSGSELRELGGLLAAIHGQHESVALLSSKVQREHLDEYAKAFPELSKVSLHWRAWSDAKALALAARERVAEMDKERSQLVWEVEEISKLAPKEDEWEAMVASHQAMAQSSEMIAACEGALAELRDDEGSIASRLSKISKSLSGFADPKAKQAALALGEAAGIVDDAARDLSRALDGGEFSKGSLEALEERMGSFHALGRKLRVSPEALSERMAAAQDRLEQLELGMDSKKLDQDEARARLDLEKSCAELSKKRSKAAVKLAAAASSNLERLGMGKARVLIELTAREPGPDGADQVEFAMMGYAGAKPMPLAKCASGGELARLGLALCAASIEQSQPGCMVFDEVDAGIGGPTATMVGEMLAVLGRKSQALAVTHLPQVAALATTHYAVGKEMGPGGPQSKVELVSGEARQREIARMLGDSKGKSALEHAVSLLGERLTG